MLESFKKYLDENFSSNQKSDIIYLSVGFLASLIFGSPWILLASSLYMLYLHDFKDEFY